MCVCGGVILGPLWSGAMAVGANPKIAKECSVWARSLRLDLEVELGQQSEGSVDAFNPYPNTCRDSPGPVDLRAVVSPWQVQAPSVRSDVLACYLIAVYLPHLLPLALKFFGILCRCC